MMFQVAPAADAKQRVEKSGVAHIENKLMMGLDQLLSALLPMLMTARSVQAQPRKMIFAFNKHPLP